MVQNIDAQFQWFEQAEKLRDAPIANLEEVCRQHLKKTLSISNVMTGDDLIPYRQLIFIHQEKLAIEFLMLELERVHTYPLRQVRILLLLVLAEYRLQQTEAAFHWFEKALLLLEQTKATRIVLDEHPLIWDILESFSQHIIRQKHKRYDALLAYIQQLQKLNGLADATEDGLQSSDHEQLSKREAQILEKLSQGCTDAEISESIFLSINTVKWHLRKIYNKLQVRSRMEAVNEAKKRGMID